MGYLNGGETYDFKRFIVQVTRSAILFIFFIRLFSIVRNAGNMAKNKFKKGKVDNKAEH